jgi:hypothetical protein
MEGQPYVSWHGTKGRNPDAFQMFCLGRRPYVAAANPGATVGTITSILASIWRSMPIEAKALYVDFSRQFYDTPPHRSRIPKQTVSGSVTTPLTLPSIYVVQRNGCGDDVQEMSINSLIHALRAGNS